MEPRALATIEINPDFNWFRFSFVGDIVGIFSTTTDNSFLRSLPFIIARIRAPPRSRSLRRDEAYQIRTLSNRGLLISIRTTRSF